LKNGFFILEWLDGIEKEDQKKVLWTFFPTRIEIPLQASYKKTSLDVFFILEWLDGIESELTKTSRDVIISSNYLLKKQNWVITPLKGVT
jgi:hypothetical protein